MSRPGGDAHIDWIDVVAAVLPAFATVATACAVTVAAESSPPCEGRGDRGEGNQLDIDSRNPHRG